MKYKVNLTFTKEKRNQMEAFVTFLAFSEDMNFNRGYEQWPIKERKNGG